MGGSGTPFQTEAWVEYGLGTAVLMLRYFARWRKVGFGGWAGDDWCAVASLVFWTAELCMLEVIGQYGTNIGVSNAVGAAMSAKEIARREFGSKCLLAGWNLYVTLIWSLKFTLLFLYARMTLGLNQSKVVKWTQYGSLVAYLSMLAIIWGHCTPVHKNWQVYPDPGPKCTLAVANYIGVVVLNISTDLVIVAIPIPLLWQVKLSIKRKLLIGLLLCSGVFIMIATLLRCVLSLRDINGINTSTIWAIRETFVGIIAVNAAAIKPLFSSTHWHVWSKGSSNDHKGSAYHGYGSKNTHALGTITGAATVTHSRPRTNGHGMTELGDNSSEEHIVKGQHDYNPYKNDSRSESSTGEGNSNVDGIVVTRTYEVMPAKTQLDV